MTSNRVFQPLKKNHPLVVNSETCPICHRTFQPGERTILIHAHAEIVSILAAVPVHATCGLRGLVTRWGTIERIKDGDGSPYPVVTDQGQFRLSEVGLE